MMVKSAQNQLFRSRISILGQAPSTKRDEVMKFELYQLEGVLYYILVYPEKRLAKIYHNKENGFKKLGDYSSGEIQFVIGECHFLLILVLSGDNNKRRSKKGSSAILSIVFYRVRSLCD